MRSDARRAVARKGPHAVIAVLVLAVSVPLLWMITASLRQGEVLTGGLLDFSDLGFGNYARVLKSGMSKSLVNSLISCGIATVLSVAIATVTAYGFSRFRFRGARVLFWAMLLLQLIPAASLVVPLYMLWGDLGLFNNLLGLALAYSGMSTAVCVLLIKNFVDEIPRELDEAAAIDGCSAWSTFFRVVVPLLRPAMAAGAVYVFNLTWQEFVIASSVINDPNLYTVTVGLQGFRGQFRTDFGGLMAGSVLTALPVVIVFAAFQRHFVRAVVGGLKG